MEVLRERKRQEESQAKVLTRLLNIAGNSACADCMLYGQNKWCSISIGVFLCIRCAGIHRKMGTDISKIKSINLDIWSTESLQYVERMGGNTKVNEKYLSRGNGANLNPGSDLEMEQYIRNKYERQLYSMGITKPSTQNVTQIAPGKSQLKYGRQIDQLSVMGFCNTEACASALEKSNGSIERAVELMVANPQERRVEQAKHSGNQTQSQAYPSQAPITSKKQEMSYQSQLKSMGFNNEALNERAYQASNGNMEQTFNLLVNHQKEQQRKAMESERANSQMTDLMGAFVAAPVHSQQPEPQQIQNNQFQASNIPQQQSYMPHQQISTAQSSRDPFSGGYSSNTRQDTSFGGSNQLLNMQNTQPSPIQSQNNQYQSQYSYPFGELQQTQVVPLAQTQSIVAAAPKQELSQKETILSLFRVQQPQAPTSQYNSQQFASQQQYPLQQSNQYTQQQFGQQAPQQYFNGQMYQQPQLQQPSQLQQSSQYQQAQYQQLPYQNVFQQPSGQNQYIPRSNVVVKEEGVLFSQQPKPNLAKDHSPNLFDDLFLK